MTSITSSVSAISSGCHEVNPFGVKTSSTTKVPAENVRDGSLQLVDAFSIAG